MAELAELSRSGTKWRGGRLLHIHVAPAASFEMEEVAEANFVAGRGIEGDQYFLGAAAVGRLQGAVVSHRGCWRFCEPVGSGCCPACGCFRAGTRAVIESMRINFTREVVADSGVV